MYEVRLNNLKQQLISRLLLNNTGRFHIRRTAWWIIQT